MGNVLVTPDGSKVVGADPRAFGSTLKMIDVSDPELEQKAFNVMFVPINDGKFEEPPENSEEYTGTAAIFLLDGKVSTIISSWSDFVDDQNRPKIIDLKQWNIDKTNEGWTEEQGNAVVTNHSSFVIVQQAEGVQFVEATDQTVGLVRDGNDVKLDTLADYPQSDSLWRIGNADDILEQNSFTAANTNTPSNMTTPSVNTTTPPATDNTTTTAPPPPSNNVPPPTTTTNSVKPVAHNSNAAYRVQGSITGGANVILEGHHMLLIRVAPAENPAQSVVQRTVTSNDGQYAFAVASLDDGPAVTYRVAYILVNGEALLSAPFEKSAFADGVYTVGAIPASVAPGRNSNAETYIGGNAFRPTSAAVVPVAADIAPPADDSSIGMFWVVAIVLGLVSLAGGAYFVYRTMKKKPPQSAPVRRQVHTDV